MPFFQPRSTCVSDKTGQARDETKTVLSPPIICLLFSSQRAHLSQRPSSEPVAKREGRQTRPKSSIVWQPSPPMLITDAESSRISISSVPSSSSSSSSTSSRIHTADVSRKRRKYPAVSLALWQLSIGTFWFCFCAQNPWPVLVSLNPYVRGWVVWTQVKVQGWQEDTGVSWYVT